MKPDAPLTGRYDGPRKRSIIASAEPIRLKVLDAAETREKLDGIAARDEEPFEVPRWLAKRVLKRTWRFRNDEDRLTTCLALLYPRGMIPSRGDVAHHAEQACSITGDLNDADVRAVIARAADAAEDLLRRGYTIPEDVILITREALARCKARRQETTDDA